MNPIIVHKADCRDCHRCMRSCQVKAIGIEKGQTRMVEEKCILCGRCVTECPQHARQVADDIDAVKEAIAAGRRVVLSLAPSFVTFFPEFAPEHFFRRLYGLGFAIAEETAVGAEIVSELYANLLGTSDKTVISACCPVVVSTVKKYYPSLAGNLAPVVSPMQAHAKLLRQRFGPDCFIVFAGPCIAKIAEREEPESTVDAVITFDQLRQWLSKSVPLERDIAPGTRDAASRARYYPIAGGILKSFTSREATDIDVIAVDGLDKCFEAFDGLLAGEIAPRFIEALACSGGCINGPAGGSAKCTPAKRRRVAEFAAASKTTAAAPGELVWDRNLAAAPVDEIMPSEARIREVLRQTGKYTRQDEKNCGACGYNTCREKAVAVCQGLTEIDTCVPYMRSKAESFANIIVDNSINAIIAVSKKMIIQEINGAAERMLGAQKEQVKGTCLNKLMDCGEITAAARTGAKIVGKRVDFAASGLVTSLTVIPVPEHDLVILVFTDVTAEEKHTRELEQMKTQTVEKATEIINKQMQVAQEIAGLLGETTAETKAALLELIWVLNKKGDN